MGFRSGFVGWFIGLSVDKVGCRLKKEWSWCSAEMGWSWCLAGFSAENPRSYEDQHAVHRLSSLFIISSSKIHRVHAKELTFDPKITRFEYVNEDLKDED